VSAAIAAAGSIFERDLRIFASYRARLVTTTLGAAVSVALFYYVSRLVTSSAIGSADDYFGFVVIGMVILAVLTAALTGPLATLRAELLAGTFERMVVSPFGPVASIVSMTMFPVVLGLVTGLITLVLAGLLFGLDIHWSTVPLALPIALLAVVAFMPFGVLLSSAMLTFKQTNAGAGMIITGLSLVAGLYFPVSLLPDWIRWTSDVQPFTPAVDLLRHVLVDTPLRESTAVSLLKLVGFAAGMLPIALLVLRAAVERSRRKGTITEY
jgi:ABC-2 type transport system permease protein